MRPLFAAPAKLEPTVELTTATSGSALTTLATRRCRSRIASNEMSCAASVVANIIPVSSVGKKPFGTVT